MDPYDVKVEQLCSTLQQTAGFGDDGGGGCYGGGEQLEVSVERDLAMRTSSGLSSEGSAQSKNAIIVGVRRRAPAAAVSSDEGGARCDREETYVAA